MHLTFDSDQHSGSPDRSARLTAHVSNDGRTRMPLTFRIETDPATPARVHGPSMLEPGQAAEVVVTVAPPRNPAHTLVRVRLTAIPTDGTDAAQATATVDFSTRRCAHFVAQPTLSLEPDGTVSAAFALLNCGSIDLSATLSVRRGDGGELTVDQPELELSIGPDPFSLSVTISSTDDRPFRELEQLECTVSVGGDLLAATWAPVQKRMAPPPGRRPARLLWPVLVAVLVAVVVLATGIGSRSGSGTLGPVSPAADTPTSSVTPSSTPVPTPKPSPEPKPPTISGFTGRFEAIGCAVTLSWSASGKITDMRLVRQNDSRSTTLAVDDRSYVDDLTVAPRVAAAASTSQNITVSYEVTASGPGGSKTATTRVTGTCKPPARPDLAVESISGNGVTVVNRGNAAAAAFTVVISGKSVSTNPLASGEERTIEDDLCEGNQWAVVDPDDRVEESDETNNSLSTQVIC